MYYLIFGLREQNFGMEIFDDILSLESFYNSYVKNYLDDKNDFIVIRGEEINFLEEVYNLKLLKLSEIINSDDNINTIYERMKDYINSWEGLE